MRRPLLVWLVFSLCAVVGLGVLAWFTVERVRLERDASQARDIAQVEGRVRLALWRIDSALAAIHGAETARPVSDYEPFSTPGKVYGLDLREVSPESLRVPSPLLSLPPQFVRMHLQVLEDGRLDSPQAPEGREREAALAAGLPEALATEAAALLQTEAFRALGAPLLAVAGIRAEERVSQLFDTAPPGLGVDAPAAAPVAQSKAARQSSDEYRLNSAELQQRAELAESNYIARNRSQVAASSAPAAADVLASPRELAAGAGAKDSDVSVASAAFGPVPQAGVFTAHWMDGKLFLVRSIEGSVRVRAQAVWLDWEALEPRLRARVADLLPSARLEPVTDPNSPGAAMRQLALLPVRLEPGVVPAAYAEESGVLAALGLAWALAGIGVAALALLLAGTLRLSERRAAFVSAVTHELRTPLTTFRLYSEMLAGGMVSDPDKRQAYLLTLQKEAGRLSHLVENVLSYARLERGSARSRVEETTPAALMVRVGERLRERAAQAGMEVEEQVAPDVADLPMRVDSSGFEQVLFNLVDNAAKYARRPDRAGRIVVALACSPTGSLLVRVADDGPGLTREAKRRLFQPFSKSAVDAANSQPGVGLGLSLSRRIARGELGGDLKLERSGPEGTCFLLEVRWAPAG